MQPEPLQRFVTQSVTGGIPTETDTAIKLAAHHDVGTGFSPRPDTHRGLKAAPTRLNLTAVRVRVGQSKSVEVGSKPAPYSAAYWPPHPGLPPWGKECVNSIAPGSAGIPPAELAAKMAALPETGRERKSRPASVAFLNG